MENKITKFFQFQIKKKIYIYKFIKVAKLCWIATHVCMDEWKNGQNRCEVWNSYLDLSKTLVYKIFSCWCYFWYIIHTGNMNWYINFKRKYHYVFPLDRKKFVLAIFSKKLFIHHTTNTSYWVLTLSKYPIYRKKNWGWIIDPKSNG